jgi:hypothetical protein
VLGRGTLWHLQKFLQCFTYILSIYLFKVLDNVLNFVVIQYLHLNIVSEYLLELSLIRKKKLLCMALLGTVLTLYEKNGLRCTQTLVKSLEHGRVLLRAPFFQCGTLLHYLNTK